MMWDKVLKMLAAAGGAIAGLFGGFDTVLMVLVGFLAVDYATGWVVALMGKSHKSESGYLDSKVGFVGIARKGLILLVVLVASLLDQALGTDAAIFRDMVIWFYLANEGLSILENLSLAGVPFPERMKAALEQLKEKHDEPPDGV
ncbi:MAG: phage holin family protein [Clostridia bacterium]|nr:phage holin family protein [Clostridia bacterium]